MKKRLRKKLRKGEFQEDGFTVAATAAADVPESRAETLLDRFIVEVIEPRGLTFGGGGSGRAWSGFVARARRGSTDEADRHAAEGWLASQPDVARFAVGPLEDAWRM